MPAESVSFSKVDLENWTIAKGMNSSLCVFFTSPFNFFIWVLDVDSIRIFFFQAEDGIRDHCVTRVQTCALPILAFRAGSSVSITARNALCKEEPSGSA